MSATIHPIRPAPRALPAMPTSELVYFEGAHFAHVVAWEEHNRLARIRRQSRQAIEARRRNGRRHR